MVDVHNEMIKLKPAYRTHEEFRRSASRIFLILSVVLILAVAGMCYYDGTEIWVCVATILVALSCLWFGWFIGMKRTKYFFENYVKKENRYKLPKDL